MEEGYIRESDSNSILSLNIGRVMNSVLTSRPRKLEDAISRAGSDSLKSSGSLEEALYFLWNYVSDAVKKGETLDQILVPMIENSLKSKSLRHCNQVLILLNWFFKDKHLFEALATNLAKVIMEKNDHYITLGWCTLIRGLVDYKTTMSSHSKTGIQEKHLTLLKIMFSSIPHLSSVLCNGSIVQGGFELPTRLAVAAADCILVLTEASAEKTTSEVSAFKTKLCEPDMSSQRVPLSSSGSVATRFEPASENMEVEVLLWDHMDELIVLVQKLAAWSRKSRPLHAKGLEQVLKWLLQIKGHCDSVSVKAGGSIPKTGMLLLSSCWKHYSQLLRLEDHKVSQHYLEMLNQYISGIQFYMNDYSKEHPRNNDGGMETRKFFLISISLLLGRLDSKQFKLVISENGLQISRISLEQLQCVDEDVIEVAVSILRAAIFKTNCSGIDRNLIDTEQMETVFPLLLSFLDERDNTAKAIVLLTAEYCSINADGQCLQEVIKRLADGNLQQKSNAIDIIAEVMHISSESWNSVSDSTRQDLSQNLLHCLMDDEPVICLQASKLLAIFDPSFVLPELVRLVYNPNERVGTAASNTVVEVLNRHNQNPEVILMLIDCLSKLCQSSEHPNLGRGKMEGSKFDSDRLLKLIPRWSKSVQDWNIFVEPLLGKMFAEPSNAVLVRFLSYLSENLTEVRHVVLNRVLLHMQGQNEIDDNLFSSGIHDAQKLDKSFNLNDYVFDRLCPLLIIRMLPLQVFDDLNSTVMYGRLLNEDALRGALLMDRDTNNDVSSSIASILLNRAFNKFELEDVRKLAAELSGRIHPQFLFPVIRTQLELATHSRDILKLKACLFVVCTSLMLRGNSSASHPVLLDIRTVLEIVLLWPSLDNDEVSKAQHGCIDCLALMICTSLHISDSSVKCSKSKISMSREKSCNGDVSSEDSVVNYVIQNLTDVRRESCCSDKLSGCKSVSAFPISFRLCMANVLISACQKVQCSGRKQLAETIIPILIHSVGMMKDSEVRAACIQVLFSAVYHLKSDILPHSCDLLKLAVKALKKGSHKEKMASVKLMASLMASDEVVVGSISGGLLEVRSVLLNICLTDPSVELRQVCGKLLDCVTSPVDGMLSNLPV